MKKVLLSAATVALLFSACSNDELGDKLLSNETISAKIANEEVDTRTTLSEQLQVVWSTNDKISVFTEYGVEYINNLLALTSGGGTANAKFDGTIEGNTKVAAVYPYVDGTSYDGSKITNFTMPAEYTYSENEISGAPMAAQITEQNADIVFKNAGAVMGITVQNIPAGYNKAILTSKGEQPLAGECEIAFDGSGNPTLKTTASATGKTITITFEATQTATTKTFYFPIPVAEYLSLEFSIGKDGETKVLKTKSLDAKRSIRYKTSLIYGGVTGVIPEVWDGETTEAPASSEDGTTYLVSNPAQWAWIAAQKTLTKNVKLMADMDFAEKKVPTIYLEASEIIIDGNGKTISNLVCEFAESMSLHAIGMFSLETAALNSTITIKNLNLDNVTAHNDYTEYPTPEPANNTYGYAAVLIGEVQNTAIVNIEGVKVTNSTVKGIQSVGTLVGFLASQSSVTVKNCTVKNCNIHNYAFPDESGYVAGLIGRPVGTATVTGSVVEDTKIDAFYASRRGENSIAAVVGGKNNEGATVTNVAVNKTCLDNVIVISTFEQLSKIQTSVTNAESVVVVLDNDIDCNNKTLNPIILDSKKVVFDGQGYKISNLVCGSYGDYAVSMFRGDCVENEADLLIKNLVVDKVSAINNTSDPSSSAVILADAQNHIRLTIDNVNINNATIDGTVNKAAGGFVGGNFTTTGSVIVKNSCISNSAITGKEVRSAAVVGRPYSGTTDVVNVSVSNVKLNNTVTNKLVGEKDE